MASPAPPARASEWEIFSEEGSIDVLADRRHILSGGPGVDGIPAMNNPVSVRPNEVEYVAEDDLVMGVYKNGVARAYPENLGWWHEIINTEVGGEYMAVTLCPLTGTAMNFNATDERTGNQIEFGVSGLLINSNLVMYDRRDNETLYPQMIYKGITGTYKDEQLELLPLVETTWSMWKKMYPDTEVVQAATGLGRYSEFQRSRYSVDSYFRYPYRDYRTNDAFLIFPTTTAQPDLETRGAKDMVLGICRQDELKSYPFEEMPVTAVINDIVGDDALVVIFDYDSRTAIPYFSDIDGEILRFYQVESEGQLPVEFMDAETGTRWDMLGRAVEGPLKGERLEQVPAYNSMWFAWDTYWNGAPVWDGEGIFEAPRDTAIEEDPRAALPDAFGLSQNYPNPFNPSTHIQVNIPENGDVKVTIYDNLGQQVRRLADGWREAGFYLFTWDGLDDDGARVASGTYVYRAGLTASSQSFGGPEAGVRSETKRMTLVR